MKLLSLPLLWLSLTFLAGILLASGLAWPVSAWLALAALAGLIGFLLLLPGLKRRIKLPLPAFPYPFLPCLLFLGAARLAGTIPAVEPGFIAWYNDLQTPFVIEGTLIEPPDARDTYTNLRIEVDQLHLMGDDPFQPVGGLLLARVPPNGTWRYGDRIRLQGQLQTTPVNEDFSYRDYLVRQGIYSYLSRAEASLLQHDLGNPLLAALFGFKDRARTIVYQLYPDPEASLLAGILLGDDNGIPQAVQDAFKATGTSHIIAISGFNIAILAGLISGTLGRAFGPRRAFIPAILIIALYTLLVGASASVVRAAIMGCLGLLARQVARRQVALNTLAVTAAVMCIATPYALWDPGFQLSFAATLGLMLYATPLAERVQAALTIRLASQTAERLTGILSDTFLLTFAAQLFTLPVIAYHFQRISLSALIVNPLVLPVQPAVMILGGLAVLVGMVWLPLGQLIAYLAWPLVVYTIRVIEGLAGIPGGLLILGELSLPLVILLYAALLLGAAGDGRFQKLRALGPAVALTILMSLTAITWHAAFAAPDGRLRITVLDVGTGDGILIQTPTGRNLLVDGGPSANKLSDALGRRLPADRRTLDWLLVAAAGDEQLTALPRVLERFPPLNVLWTGDDYGTRSARDVQAFLAQRSIPQTTTFQGHTLDLGSGVSLRGLAVGPRGGVFLLVWNRFRMLLPCGVDFEQMDALHNGAAIGPVNALLLADSGYGPSNPPEWVAALSPQVIVFSFDPKKAPDPQADLNGYTIGYNVLRTDRNGWIELTTDGEQMWLTVEKNAAK